MKLEEAVNSGKYIEIHSYQPKRITTKRLEANTFFTTNYLLKFVCKALCAIGLMSEMIYDEVRIERTVVDLDDLFYELLKQQANIDIAYNKTCTRIICGLDIYQKIVRSETFNQYVGFTVPQDFRLPLVKNGNRKDFIFAGMTVDVIPWIDGIFLLPE